MQASTLKEPRGAKCMKAIGLNFNQAQGAGNLVFTNCVINNNAGDGDNHIHPENDQAPNMLMDDSEPELLTTCCKKDSPATEHILKNDVLIHNQRAHILSVLYKNDKSLKDGTDILKKNYTSIISLQGQVVASKGSTVKLTMRCKIPPVTRITPKNTTCKISRELLMKSWYQRRFQLVSPNKHAEEYKVIYSATVRNLKNQRTDGGFSDEFSFRWPLVPQYQERNGEEKKQEALTSRDIDVEAESSSRLPDVASEQDNDYFTDLNTALQQACNQKDVKVQIVGPEGAFVELEECNVEIKTGAVSEKKEVEVSLDINPDHFPDSVGLIPISHILKCKPSVFEQHVRVRLKSFLIPKSEKELCFKILSKTGEGEWKTILEGNVDKSVIEYEVNHFCSHVAVVLEEDEENGEYHLFNDVWMHIETGRILSIFWKGEGALKKGSKVLEIEHERILPLPEELFVSVGNIIVVDIRCDSPPGMRMASIDGSNGRWQIGHEIRKKNFFTVFFRPEPHPDKIQSTEPYEVYYHATILDAAEQPVEGGFSDLLDFEWPLLQSKEPNRVSEEKRESSLFNGVWMHVENAKILSVFCKEEIALMNKGTYLGNEYKRILSLPEELLVPTSCTVKAGFDCVEPRNLRIDGSPTNKLKINSPLLRKNSHQLYFQPIPHPDKLNHTGSYEVSYYVRLYDSKCQLISEGIDAPLDLCWPLHSQHKMPTGEREQASTSGTQNINIDEVYASGDAYIGGQGQHIDHRQKGREDTPAAGATSADQLEGMLLKMEYLEHVDGTMEQSCRQSSSLMQEIGPNGGSIELDGCGVHPPPGTIKKNMEIKVSVGVKPCPSPSSGTQITRMLKRKPSNMDTPIPVKLTSWLVPKPKKKLPVMIISKTGDSDWKVIHKTTLNDGNIIEYNASHFCWHVAVVSEEDEKNGEYHLLNDVWMHVRTGRILSVFWKDEIALQNASKALEADHKRILPIPGEIIVSVGDTLIVDIECNSPPGVRMINIEGSDARVEITHERMKKNFFTLLFWPNPHPEKIQSAEPYEVLYSANTLDAEGQPADGGFSAPLDYEWPPKPIEGKDGKGQVHRLWNRAWVNKYGAIALLFCENKETHKLKTTMSSQHIGKMILDTPQPVVVCEGDFVTVKLYDGISMETRHLEHVEVIKEKTLFWNPFCLKFDMQPSKPLNLCYAVEILRSKTGLAEEAFSVPFSWEPPLEPPSGCDILHYVSPMVLSSPLEEGVEEPVSSIVLSPPGKEIQEPDTKNVTAPDERKHAEASLTKKRPIKTQGLKRGSDRSLTEPQFKADNSSNLTTSAAFMRTGDGNGGPPKITLTWNSKIDISADDNRAKDQKGTSKTEAYFVDGKANVEGQAQIK